MMSESLNLDNGTKPNQDLKRGMSNRHIQLISIGGAIGTGLFMGAGKTISLSGTSIILTYMIIGFFVFFLMRAMGEMLLADLRHKTFIDYCAEYLGPWAGYFLSWSYWLAWVVVAIADCTVIGGYMQFWFPDLPTWMPAFSSLLILFLLNLIAVKIFGEVEFWFALIKVVAIVVLIVVGFGMVAMSYVSPNGVVASVSHLTETGSIFPFGISGFFAGFQIAVFAFTGVELVGVAAAETKDPEKNLPKAINAVPVRVLLFYVLALSCIICVSSWAEIAANKSPFVQVFVLAGLPAAASIINLVVITSAMSAANSGVFATARMLFGLSLKGHTFKAFSFLSKTQIPLNGLVFSCICMALGLSLLFLVPEVMAAFTILTTVSALLSIFYWSMMLVAYLRYRARDPHLHEASKFKMPAGILMSWLTLGFLVFTICLLALEKDTLIGLTYIPLWFILLTVTYLLRRKKIKEYMLDEQKANS